MKINKYPIFGINYSATDYNEASDVIIEMAKENKSFSVSALAVHGLIESYRNKNFYKIVNNIDMIVPDGHPVKWALNNFHGLNLKDRVCGVELSVFVLEKANKHNLKLFLFGSTEQTLNGLINFIKKNYPQIEICGSQADRFRDATEEEDNKDIELINKSGAQIVFVGRGCPRQEKWVESHKNKINAVMMAIGAAFDFHANKAPRAPKWMRDNSMEWLFRLLNDPKRLWKRYFITNSIFIYLVLEYKFSRMFSKSHNYGK